MCRLASVVIESPASVAFLHALMYSPRTDLIGVSQNAGCPCYEFRRSDTSAIQDSEDPRLALKRLAPNLQWVLADDEEFLNDYGKTCAIWVDCSIVDNGRHGYQSTIMIRNILIAGIKWLSRQADKTCELLSAQFLLAKTLCQEVVHAFNIALDPALVSAHTSDLASHQNGKSSAG